MLDASVTLAWCFEDEEDASAVRFLRLLSADHEAVVPGIWKYEVVNGLAIARRRKRLKENEHLEIVGQLGQLPIQESDIPETLEALLETAHRYGLASYDAAYLHLAIRAGLPIATNDAGLRRAARRARVRLMTA